MRHPACECLACSGGRVLERIARGVSRAAGVRLSAEETALLQTALELSESDSVLGECEEEAA